MSKIWKFEQRITRWRGYIRKNPKQGFADSDMEATTLQEVWIKRIHPVLARPDTNKRFYLKRD
jgi:hypothetical protein